MANNVIVFPKSKVETTKQAKMEDIQKNLEMMKHYHIQETILNLTPIIFNQLDIAGFGLSEDGDEDIKYGAFIVESLRAYMLKHYDEFHPFQILSEKVFQEKDNGETLKIVDELIIDLRNPDEEKQVTE